MLVPGTVLRGSYTIVRLIAQGGMGAVYLAKHQRLHTKTVAVKETFFDDAALLRAFEREAQLLAGLRHAALPHVLDHFSEGDGHFLVMEFIAGDDLGEMLKKHGGAFAVKQVLDWGDQLLGALAYLHKQTPPVIHRDIKPQNLKLTEEGQLVLLDFGLAKGQAEGMSRMTSGHSLHGYTPHYAPLEQIQGVGTDARSDLYALAATLYHLITGFAPVDALSRAAVVVTGQPDPLRPANALNPQVPQRVAHILMAAMALNRDYRPASAAAMRRLLSDAAGNAQPTIVTPVAPEMAATLPMASHPRIENDPAIINRPSSMAANPSAPEARAANLAPPAESLATHLRQPKIEPSPPPSTGAGGVATAEGVAVYIGRYRWVICALLFFAATINYIDRQVIGLLKPTLTLAFAWSELDYSWIVFAFQTAYALGLLVVGRLMDRLGTRKGFSFALVVWSLAAMGHALVSSVMGFSIARFMLGLGESGNFPASIKTVAEWFPKKERALATGIFNAGTNVGVIAAALIVPAITATWGWRWAFILTGAIGFIWLIFWLALYRKPPASPTLSHTQQAYIESEPTDSITKIPWGRLFPHRQTWAFALGKFMTDPIWWVYLFWLPDYLHKQQGLNLSNFGPPLVAIYLIADIGSVAGGWLSSTLLRRGSSLNVARKTAMLICALCVVPIIFASQTSSLWVAVLLIGLAAAAHQGWSANLYTIASDTFPRCAIGSVVGIGGMAGAVGGMLISLVVGKILETTGSYVPIFIMAASAYLLALGVIHLLAPRLEPANLEPAAN